MELKKKDGKESVMSHFLGTYFKRQPFLCVSSFLPPSHSLEQRLWGQGSHLSNGWKESGSLRALLSRAASQPSPQL